MASLYSIIILEVLGLLAVWAACPAALNTLPESMMTVTSPIKVQLGESYNLRSATKLGSMKLLKETTQKAMVNNNYAYTTSSTYVSGFGVSYGNPRLDSTVGFFNDYLNPAHATADYWVEIDFGGDLKWVHEAILEPTYLAEIITQIQIKYFVGGIWRNYDDGNDQATGMLVTDAVGTQRTVNLVPFQATKVKLIVPRSGRNLDQCGGKLEFMVSSWPGAETTTTEAQFNANFQEAVTASTYGIIERTCTLGTYCQTAKMYYKRINPYSATFSPYSKLLGVWEQGTDNVHGTDFEIYPTLADAIANTNKYAYCDFPSGMLAFGRCGATAAVDNNFIRASGTSTGLQEYQYVFTALSRTSWSSFYCKTGYEFDIASGSTSSITINKAYGTLGGTAAGSHTLTFSLKVSGLTTTSNSVTFNIFDCIGQMTFHSSLTSKSAFVGQTFPSISGAVTSTNSDCSSLIGTAEYSLSSVVTGVSIHQNTGVITVDTSNAISQTQFTVSVKIGTQTITSTQFNIEVKSCASLVSFTSLASSYSVFAGQTPPTINSATASTNAACVIDASSYVLIHPVGGISMTSIGAITVNTTGAIALTSLTTSFTTNGGAETHTSSPFTVEVKSCLTLIKFPNLSPLGYSTQIGFVFPDVDASTASTNSACVVDSASYALSPSVDGISMDSSGTTTVITTKAIDQNYLTVSVTTNGGVETHTSAAFSVWVEDCLAAAKSPQIGVKKVQKSSSSNTIDAGFSSSANCAPNSYVFNQDFTGVTIDEAGQITADASQFDWEQFHLITDNTSLTIAATHLTVSATVGTQKISKSFKIEVYDCTSAISFQNLPSDIKVPLGQELNATAISAMSSAEDCIIDQSSYKINGSASFVQMDSSGSLKIDNSNVTTPAYFKVSVTVRSQTIESQPFTIVVQPPQFEEKLLVQPKKSHLINIGKINWVELGKFQGNDIAQVLVFYQISKASNASLERNFKVGHTYNDKTGEISLKIDLTKTDPSLENSSVIGKLSISNLVQEKATYEIEFSLVCLEEDLCSKTKIVEVEAATEEESQGDGQLIELTEAQKTKERLETFINDILRKKESGEELEIPATILKMQINQYGQLIVLFSKDVKYPKIWYELLESGKRMLQATDESEGGDEDVQFLKIGSSDDKQRSIISSLQLKSLSERKLKVQIDFNDPESVSMSSQSSNDELSVEFQAEFPILDAELDIPLVYKTDDEELNANDFSFERRVQIPPQINMNNTMESGIRSTAEGAKATSFIMILVMFALSYLMGSGLNYLFSFLVGLQYVLLMPLMSLKFPAILNQTFQIIIPITMFDPVPEEGLELINDALEFKDTLQEPMNPRFSNLGFENRNFIAAIGGNFYTILFVHIQVLVIYLIKKTSFSKSQKGQDLVKKLQPEKGYLEFMVSFIIQMYCEFLMASMINFENLNIFNSNENPLRLNRGPRFAHMTPSDIFTFVYAIVWCIILVVAPLFFIAAINKKSKGVILSKESGVIKDIEQEDIYSDLWSDLMLRSDKYWRIHYFTFFFGRRLSFIFLCYYTTSATLQLLLFTASNLAFTAYLIEFKPFLTSRANKMEVATEYLTLVIGYLSFNFTDFAYDVQSKRYAGFMVVAVMALIICINVAALLKDLYRWILLYRIKQKNIKEHEQEQLEKNQIESSGESSSSSEEEKVNINESSRQRNKRIKQQILKIPVVETIKSAEESKTNKAQIDEEVSNSNESQVIAKTENRLTKQEKKIAIQTITPNKTEIIAVRTQIKESKRRQSRFGRLGGKKTVMKPIKKDLTTIHEHEEIESQKESQSFETQREESKLGVFDLEKPFKGGQAPQYARTRDVIPTSFSAPMPNSIDRLRQQGAPFRLHEDHFKPPRDEFSKFEDKFDKLCKKKGIKRFKDPKW